MKSANRVLEIADKATEGRVGLTCPVEVDLPGNGFPILRAPKNRPDIDSKQGLAEDCLVVITGLVPTWESGNDLRSGGRMESLGVHHVPALDVGVRNCQYHGWP